MSAEELADLVRNLPQVESLDLYRLEYVLRSLYHEPRRVLAIRIHLRLGMMVRFFGRNTGAFHSGRIMAMNDQGMTIDESALKPATSMTITPAKQSAGRRLRTG